MDGIGLSIVIPAYNAEQYVGKCLDSILSQNGKGYEIICVNDGSTDGTANILENYSKKYDCVKYYSQENRYAGAARNLGIDKSSGEYVWFVDADDYVNGDSLRIIDSLINDSKGDMIAFNYLSFDDRTNAVKKVDLFYAEGRTTPDGIVYGVKKVKDDVHSMIATSVMPWNKVYSRDFIIRNGLRFDEIPSANDRSFYFKAISRAGFVVQCNYELVFYRNNVGRSLTSRMDLKRLDCCLKSFQSSKEYIADDDIFYEVCKATVLDIVYLLRKCDADEKPAVFRRVVELFNGELDIPSLNSGEMCEECILYRFYKDFEKIIDVPEEKIVPIALAADSNYLPYLAVTVRSIIDTGNEDRFYDIFVLHSTELLECDIRNIEDMQTGNVRITFVDTKPMFRDDFYTTAHYSTEMFNRIFVPELLCHYSKVCYLDCDTVLMGDISEFYSMDVSEYVFAAVTDECDENMRNYIRSELKLSPESYFNSGVLLINTVKFNENGIKEKCFELLEKNRFYVCPDQDVLNVACDGLVKIMKDDEWNFQWFTNMSGGYNEKYSGQKLIHYTSAEKPWFRPNYSLSRYFWEYARKTVFYEKILYKDILSDEVLDMITGRVRELIDANFREAADEVADKVRTAIREEVDRKIAENRKRSKMSYVKGGFSMLKREGFGPTYRYAMELIRKRSEKKQ